MSTCRFSTREEQVTIGAEVFATADAAASMATTMTMARERMKVFKEIAMLGRPFSGFGEPPA